MDREEKEALGRKLLLCCRNGLYPLYPYLDGAFASLPMKPWEHTESFGTDGESLLYCPDHLIRCFGEDPARLRRGYLHLLLHLVYLHPFRRGDRCRELWNLACDMAIEQILSREDPPGLRLPPDPVRAGCLGRLGDQPLDAAAVYEVLLSGDFPFSRQQMAEAFRADDHGPWENLCPGSRETWQQVLAAVNRNRRAGKRAGAQAGDRQEDLGEISPGKYDYRRYLRQFAVTREEMELDMDSFDYIYYHLGLEWYGNLPLMEPLEYREGSKLQQLVIAIDTSGSCSRQVVADFLAETYSILSARENFFSKMEVYLIQCDCLVQSVAVIHSEEEWKNYSRAVTIQGRGGTDFTPVFRYVEDLRSRGKLRGLKALLYFTDGDGCYPREKPPYETAFVFLKRTEYFASVPGWARKLLVEECG